MEENVGKTEAEWGRQPNPEQHDLPRRKGTERAFTGASCDHHEGGRTLSVCCGTELFSSGAAFDSGYGWLSVMTPQDASHSMRRTEVLGSRCDAHLGHVSDDGPEPTGLRFCVSSASMRFVERARGS